MALAPPSDLFLNPVLRCVGACGHRPDLFILQHTEMLLFSVLGLESALEQQALSVLEGSGSSSNTAKTFEGVTRNATTGGWMVNGSVACARRHSLCAAIAQNLANTSAHCHSCWDGNHSRRHSNAPVAVATHEHWHEAGKSVASIAKREWTLETLGCAALTARALEVLAPLTYVMFLEDEQTMKSAHRAAAWKPDNSTSRPHNSDTSGPSLERMDDTRQYATHHFASSSADRWKAFAVAAYTQQDRLMTERNWCSLQAYEAIRARYAERFL